jgi:1-acyl-sn-glycerol-3-phosphate acyltransferase
VPRRGGALLVSNHQSYLDPVLLGVRLDRPLNYIAKSELFENRVGSWLLRSIFNAFPVRQGAGDVAAVRETIARLREGHLLNIYPEGARTTDGAIGPMLRGVGLIVHRAGVPVVPVVIVGAYDAWPIHRRYPRARPVRVTYGPPLNLNGLDADEIVNVIDQTLRAMFEAAGKRDGSTRWRSDGDGLTHENQPAVVRSDGREKAGVRRVAHAELATGLLDEL